LRGQRAGICEGSAPVSRRSSRQPHRRRLPAVNDRRALLGTLLDSHTAARL